MRFAPALVLLALSLWGCGAQSAGLGAQASGGMAARNSGVTLDLLSYNTWGLPAPMGHNLKKRFAALSGALGGHDVVALQETFTTEAKQLIEGRAYPHGFRQSDGGFPMRLGSGLTVLSRFPMTQIRFKPFDRCSLSDCHNRKGVLFTRLEVPGVGSVDVYDTHYQSYTEHVAIRIDDNRVMEKFVKENDRGYPTFLLGDFNMLEGEAEYKDLMTRFSPTDIFRKSDPMAPWFTWDPARNKFATGSAQERLDYIFYLPSKSHDLDIVETRFAFENDPLSDHFGLRAKVRLSAR